MRSFRFFAFFTAFHSSEKILLFVSLYKGLVEFLLTPSTRKTFYSLGLFQEAFGSFMVTDFMSIMPGFSIDSDCFIIIFVCLINFLFFRNDL